jgi:acyl-CoA hydrolase
MEICVHSYIEEPNGIRKLINTAYFVMVALDEEEKPSKVPQIILETEEEKTEYEFAKMRQTLRKSRRNGDFYLNE